jgi:hypothetical protein
MKAQYQPCIIFSAELSDNTMVQNKFNSREVSQQLTIRGIPFETILGSYKGSEEISFIVSYEYLAVALRLAKSYNQHSILLRDNENNASLRILESGEFVNLGKMVNVSVEEALENDSWSFHPKLNKYFICKAV